MMDNSIDIEYNRVTDFLFNQFPSYQQVGKIAYKEGLDSMMLFDTRLNSPHKRFKTIHVAGTNGKGSVSHMLASVLMELGLKVGLYTSPHLIDFRERIKINGSMISKEDVVEFVDEHKEFMISNKNSFFEITTAMAFDYFAKKGVDIAVIETGLGGRLDSTNIISPILSIITNISLDHCEHLGYSVRDIAHEKAGIIKKGTPVVIGEYTSVSKEVFSMIADKLESKILFAQDCIFSDLSLSDYTLDLKGECQLYNLRTVLTALSELSLNYSFIQKVEDRWSDINIRKGLSMVISNTGLRGRWEKISTNPDIICDTGHNFAGLSLVFSQLKRENYDRLFCVIGLTAEKDIDKILGILPRMAYYLFTKAHTNRACDPCYIENKAKNLGLDGEVCDNVERAIERFYEIYKKGDLLFIGGSTFVVADALKFFEKK